MKKLKRTRPLSRLEGLVDTARIEGTYELMAREVALTMTRRFPHISVERALDVLHLAGVQLEAADDRASEVMRLAIDDPPLNPRMRLAVLNGSAKGNEAKGVKKKWAGSGRKRDPLLLKRVLGFRRAHPGKDCSEAYRALAPGIGRKAFRGYWDAVESHLQHTEVEA